MLMQLPPGNKTRRVPRTPTQAVLARAAPGAAECTAAAAVARL
jgi:hypothetical protein